MSRTGRLARSIRAFLAADRDEFGWQPTVDAWLSSWDEGGFSARLGAAGFLGLTIPREYGGQGLSHLHRYVVTEELLAVGAPVAAHWIADRQVAPGCWPTDPKSNGNGYYPKKLLLGNTSPRSV